MEPEELDQQADVRPWWKRVYVWLIAVFLIVLFAVNTTAGYHIINLVAGKIVSSTLDEYTFSLPEGQVVFEPAVYEALRQHYLDNQEVEIKACLTGYKDNKTYYVEGIYIPVIYQQSVHSVTSAGCNASTIVSLHSHPYLSCLFSRQDLSTFENFRQINPDGIIGLMCAQDRLTFFGY